MNALNLTSKLYLGQNEVLLIDADLIMRYARVLIVNSQKTVDVSYAALRNERESLIPISLAWFGGKRKYED